MNNTKYNSGYDKSTTKDCMRQYKEWKGKDYLNLCWNGYRNGEGKEEDPLSVGDKE